MQPSIFSMFNVYVARREQDPAPRPLDAQAPEMRESHGALDQAWVRRRASSMPDATSAPVSRWGAPKRRFECYVVMVDISDSAQNPSRESRRVPNLEPHVSIADTPTSISHRQ